MSDDQKIWFIYLTDHHEGPFTAAEIADKAKAGLVSGQSLAWKDGMPEWVPAETIPELTNAMANSAALAEIAAADMSGVSKTGNMIASPSAEPEAAAAPAAGGDDGVSLAQLLANSQGGGAPAENTNSGQISDNASVLSSMVSQVHANASSAAAAPSRSGVSMGGGTGSINAGGAEPTPDEEVWTLKIGSQVSGLHSLRKLKDLAGGGEIPPDAMVWHPGWSDFQSVSTVPVLEAARGKAKAGGGGAMKAGGSGFTRTGITRPGIAMSASSNAALDGDEEPTDTNLEAPPPTGFKGILFKIHKLSEKLKKKKAPARKENTREITRPGLKGGLKKSPGGAGGAVKRIAGLLVGLSVLGGAGYFAYDFLLSSPIPATVDVTDEDRQAMVDIVKAKDSKKLYLAQSHGTDESPADPVNPKYFVASNLPEGAVITLSVVGVPGTLVNRVSFDKQYTAPMEKGHVAIFDKISDDGKPLPWGEYNLKVTADGADALDVGKKFIGMKGGAYQKRLKTYKDSVQGEYDKEIADLKEYITTLKQLQVEASKQIADYKQGWATAGNRTGITARWAEFTKNSGVMISQLDTGLKARAAPDKAPKYHQRAFSDVSTTVGQLGQLVKAHGERLTGATPSANADELEGLVQAGVQALEAWLASAVVKTPFDAAKPDASGKTAVPPATTAPAAAPPAAPAPAVAPAATLAPATAPAPPAASAPASAPAAAPAAASPAPAAGASP
jgi:hypothetical protein